MSKRLNIETLELVELLAVVNASNVDLSQLAAASNGLGLAIVQGIEVLRRDTPERIAAVEAHELAQAILEETRDRHKEQAARVLAGADEEFAVALLANLDASLGISCAGEIESVTLAQHSVRLAESSQLKDAEATARRFMQDVKQESRTGMAGIASRVIRFGRKARVCTVHFDVTGRVTKLEWGNGDTEENLPRFDFRSKSHFAAVLSAYVGTEENPGARVWDENARGKRYIPSSDVTADHTATETVILEGKPHTMDVQH